MQVKNKKAQHDDSEDIVSDAEKLGNTPRLLQMGCMSRKKLIR